MTCLIIRKISLKFNRQKCSIKDHISTNHEPDSGGGVGDEHVVGEASGREIRVIGLKF
jgi:hypothetical protein